MTPCSLSSRCPLPFSVRRPCTTLGIPSPRLYHKDYYESDRNKYDRYRFEGEDEEPESKWIYDRRKNLGRAGIVATGAGLYYWTHLETAPITNRKRFMQVSPEQEKMLAQISFDQIMNQYGNQLLPKNHPVSRYVEKVAWKIIKAIDPVLLPGDTKWRIFVIDAPIANAFVLPGGEIFIFTGILPIAQSEDGLAAVLGHEIAHKVARHIAEKVSFHQFTSLALTALQLILTGDFHMPFASIIRDLVLFLPFSRKCELEADYIGMLFMARACYDPAEAVGLWRRMGEQEGKAKQPPAFLSTHPGHKDRIKAINEWMPEARRAYDEQGCLEGNNALSSFFKAF